MGQIAWSVSVAWLQAFVPTHHRRQRLVPLPALLSASSLITIRGHFSDVLALVETPFHTSLPDPNNPIGRPARSAFAIHRCPPTQHSISPAVFEESLFADRSRLVLSHEITHRPRPLTV